jgi:hypothetical protein
MYQYFILAHIFWMQPVAARVGISLGILSPLFEFVFQVVALAFE